jgi:cell division septal protein FtsQ
MKRRRASLLALDRLVASSTLALPWPVRHRRARARGGRTARLRPLPVLGLLASTAAAALARHTRMRAAMVALLLASPLAFGGWLWFRTSSLVAVDHVRVSGAHGPQARAIERALVTAGRRMTTLRVSRAALLAAVAPFHLVRDITVSTSFPHSMSIHVVEDLPVATLLAQGAQTALAADGMVLGPAFVSRRLPTVTGSYQPPTGGQVHEGSLRAALVVLGAAPAPVVRLIAHASGGPRGVTVVMRNGLRVYFGDASRPHAKWLALALVLADSSSAHAYAIDVRVPERPAALLPEGSTPSGGEAGQTAGASSSEAIAAALAASAGYGSSAEAQGSDAAKAAEAAAQGSAPTEHQGEAAAGAESGAAASSGQSG